MEVQHEAHSSLVGWSLVLGSWETHQSSVSSLRSHQRARWGRRHTGSWWRRTIIDFPSINFMCKKSLLAKMKFKYKSSTNSCQEKKKKRKHFYMRTCKSTNRPEQVVALLVCVGVQLCHWLVLLDEFEELWGVQLRISAVKLLQRHKQMVVYISSPPVTSDFFFPFIF